MTRVIHGDATSGRCAPEYKVWSAMKARCHNANDPSFPNYGGRGIAVAEQWHNYATFIADMGHRPTHAHTIDRIDNARGYEPGNCRWATRREQMNNMRLNRRIAWRGQVKTLAQWAASVGMDRCVLGSRLRIGWPLERALETPVRHHSAVITANGETASVAEWARRTGLPDKLLYKRLAKGWPSERILTPPTR